MTLRSQLVAMPNHLNELLAPQLEVCIPVVAKYRGVVCRGVLERFVDVAFEDGCPDFCVVLARVG